ncbi:heme ABC exporter ATP-binding protein CcmA [Acidisoma cellulosilytica]|uniref:Heme ABC exporter ATP-binding protein CcmA n=1 Tax=Acidisoma cellulosilyticum TaxID=2802395 RepID=A0A963Z211_9PROT|nr:heme ABC exporter ATP-binding protein CcmA [Acidisoma cellulosilyticum]MCB8880512.1 heme ABC exporter ATP-binding protein CcmA [Acidisoma cellulosilyticum]
MLEIRSIAAIRGDHLLFEDLSFTVAEGEAVALTGRNGAGKTTLLRMIAGLTPLASGAVLWAGADALADPSAHHARLAYLGHQDAVKPGLTVSENLRHWTGGVRASRDARIQAALEQVDLLDLADIPARMLSAGQKRRLAIGRLCLRQAALWLLDEPVTGLDTASIARFGAMIARHRAEGGMVIAATHQDLPMAEGRSVRLS